MQNARMRTHLPLLLSLLGCPDPTEDPPVETDTLIDETDTDPVVVETDTDAGDTDTIDPNATTWQIGDLVVCSNPGARDANPYVLHEPGGDWATQPFNPGSTSLFVGGSLTIADFNGDGHLDMMMTDRNTDFTLYEGGPGLTYTNRTAWLPAMPERTTGVTAVDLEGDGDLDVVVSVFRDRNVILINDGTGHFTNEAAAFGLEGDPEMRTMSSSWFDLDNDGDLDGLFGGYGDIGGSGGLPDGDPSMLVYRQDDGSYLDIVPGLTDPNPLRGGHTFGGAFTDADGDGWQDLYMINDFGWRFPSLLMRNDAGALTWDETTGAQQARENMGLGVGDVNGDGIPDFLVAAWDVLGLFESVSTGLWINRAETRGITQDHTRGQRVAWGAELIDVDNDTDLDAAVAFGYLKVSSNNVNPKDQPDALYLQGANGSFTDVAPAWGIDDILRARGFLFVDLDRDGWLDLIKRDLRGPTRIYKASCGSEAWLGIDVRQPGENPFGIGTHITVEVGNKTLVREIRAGGTSYASGGPPEVHFGLGDSNLADRVIIRWPDGHVDERVDVPTRRWIQAVRP